MQKAHIFNPGDTIVVSNIKTVKSGFDTLLMESNKIRLDFSRVENIDTIGLQLILAFLQSAKKQSLQIEEIALSDSVKTAMKRICSI